MSRSDDFRNNRTPWENENNLHPVAELHKHIADLYDIAADNRRQADRLWVVLIMVLCLVSAIALYLWIK